MQVTMNIVQIYVIVLAIILNWQIIKECDSDNIVRNGLAALVYNSMFFLAYNADLSWIGG